MKRFLLSIIALAGSQGSALFAQADPDPAFEVATIKLHPAGDPGRAFQVKGRLFTTFNTSVVDLMTFAYGLHPRQITGRPSWISSDKFDVAGEPDGNGQPSDEQWKRMVQKLLADRFQRTVHYEQKELPVYAIVIAKNGPKLTKSADPNGPPNLFFRGLGMLPARNATVADLADVLQRAVLDRPVVDKTGLTGRWDFVLTWTPDETQFASLGFHPRPGPDSSASPDLFTAIRQQLGLTLESDKELLDVLVIDHVEKPSSN
jgi:uncharacterized protein (TIGR03435 family)